MSRIPMRQRMLLYNAKHGINSGPHVTMEAVVRRGYATWLTPARMSVRITREGREYLRSLWL